MSGYNPKRNDEMCLENMLNNKWETDTKTMMTGQEGINKMMVGPLSPFPPPPS